MKKALVAVCGGLMSALLTACYDLTADGTVITGSTVSLYTLDDQQNPIKTVTTQTSDIALFNGLINFFPLPAGQRPEDGAYLVEACGGEADGVSQDGCRYTILRARFFFPEDDFNSWRSFRNFWAMTPITDTIARIVKDAYSHSDMGDLDTLLDETAAAFFPGFDANDDGETTYDDLTHAEGGDYDREITGELLSDIADRLTGALAQDDDSGAPAELIYPTLAIKTEGTEVFPGYQFESELKICLEPEGGNLDDFDIGYTSYLKINDAEGVPVEVSGSLILPLDDDDCYTLELATEGRYALFGLLITDEEPQSTRIRSRIEVRSIVGTPATPPIDVEEACLDRAEELGFINLEAAINVYTCTDTFATGGFCGPDALGRTVPVGEDVCSIAYQ